MRKAEFIVPAEAAVEFSDAMMARQLSNTITGTTKEGELAIEVQYEKQETKQVDELEAILDKLIEQLEQEREEQEQEDENR